MDISDAAQRLRLDLDAVGVSASLTRAGIPHALLKGPSTANWLYDPPRVYNDIDMLVPRSAVRRTVAALKRDGIAERSGGRVGEESAHCLAMRTTTGFELDLHVSLWGVPVRGDRVWNALASHVVPLELDVGRVPQLDEAGRCLMLALHALGTDGRLQQKVEDLRRGWSVASQASRDQARALARSVGVEDLLDGGLARLASERPAVSKRAQLYLDDAPSGALALQRLRDAPWWQRPLMAWQEAFPSPAFVRAYHSAGSRTVIGAYLDRVRFLWQSARALGSPER